VAGPISHPHLTQPALEAPYRLTATVPEKFNLQLRVQSTGLRHGAILTAEERAAEAPVIEVVNKVEGDVEVFTRHGDVRVGKLRCVGVGGWGRWVCNWMGGVVVVVVVEEEVDKHQSLVVEHSH
jgi:hypothetical protein